MDDSTPHEPDGREDASAKDAPSLQTTNPPMSDDTAEALLLGRVTDAFLALDAQWRVVYLNDRAAQALGRPREDLLGKELWAELPEGVDGPFHRAYTRALSTQLPAHFEEYSPTRGRWFENHLYPSPEGLTIFFTDITERKRTEQALREANEWLRLALHGGGLASGNVDLTTRQFLHVSDTYKAHFGLPPDAEFSLDTLVQAIHPADRPQVRAAFEQAVGQHRDYEATYRVVWPDGSVHWLSAHGTPVYDEAGRPVRMIGVVQEITGRKELEAQQEQALREAKERADHDPLTGLLNHHAFYVRLEEETPRASREGTSLAVAVLDLDNFKFFNDVYGHSVGDQVLRSVAERLRTVCRPYDAVSRLGGDEFALLLGGIGSATHREIEARLRDGLRDLNFLPEGHDAIVPVVLSVGVALYPEHSSERLEVVKLADARLLESKVGGAADGVPQGVRAATLSAVAGFSLLDALVTAVDNKDRYTRRHSDDVLTYSLMIARELGLSEAEQHTTEVSALLHDVGKIGVPDSILRKPGQLTEEEFAAVRQHPQMGAIIVQAVPGLEGTLDAVRHHHERWDGMGYPLGLKGEETPLIARLLAVADSFSAMTTDRPYRKGISHEEALLVLQTGAGAQWDPECVEAFLRSRKDKGGH